MHFWPWVAIKIVNVIPKSAKLLHNILYLIGIPRPESFLKWKHCIVGIYLRWQCVCFVDRNTIEATITATTPEERFKLFILICIAGKKNTIDFLSHKKFCTTIVKVTTHVFCYSSFIYITSNHFAKTLSFWLLIRLLFPPSSWCDGG